jgi:predicted nucleotidyltransferase
MDGEDDNPQPEALSTRPPEEKDLVALCGELNRHGARYVVVGGFAIIAGGYPRFTSDIDLLIDTSLENEARVRKALETLPDRAVDDMKPGEVHQFKVIRIADEIMVDLMESACGIEYDELAKDAVIREVKGVPIPFASLRMLWRMKKPTRREKDIPDLLFLKQWFASRGETPPEC